ncbi:MAG: 30S ribosomal protein S6 [Thermoleophilaceae bacterium]
MVARSMPLYDLMLLLDPTAPSERRDTIMREVEGLLGRDGDVTGTYDWGTRRMAFEIDHRPEADYHLFQFQTEPGGALLERIDHSLKIMDGVLRHRIIRIKEGSPPPPMPRPEGRRDAAADGAPDQAAPPADQAAAPVEQAAAPTVEEAAAAPAEQAEPAAVPAPPPALAPETGEDQAAASVAVDGDDETPPDPAAA